MADAADSTPQEPNGRDQRGRFARGNKAGRGSVAARRMGELRAAIDDAVGVADLRAVLSKLRDLAVAGDVQAASLLLAHAVGKPREKQPTVGIDLGPLDDAAAIARALQRVAFATAAGEIEPAAADTLASLVAAVGDARALLDLEARIAALEASRATI